MLAKPPISGKRKQMNDERMKKGTRGVWRKGTVQNRNETNCPHRIRKEEKKKERKRKEKERKEIRREGDRTELHTPRE